MSDYNNHGKATIFNNEDANAENKRPNLSGMIEITEHYFSIMKTENHPQVIIS